MREAHEPVAYRRPAGAGGNGKLPLDKSGAGSHPMIHDRFDNDLNDTMLGLRPAHRGTGRGAVFLTPEKGRHGHRNSLQFRLSTIYTWSPRVNNTY